MTTKAQEQNRAGIELFLATQDPDDVVAALPNAVAAVVRDHEQLAQIGRDIERIAWERMPA